MRDLGVDGEAHRDGLRVDCWCGLRHLHRLRHLETRGRGFDQQALRSMCVTSLTSVNHGTSPNLTCGTCQAEINLTYYSDLCLSYVTSRPRVELLNARIRKYANQDRAEAALLGSHTYVQDDAGTGCATTVAWTIGVGGAPAGGAGAGSARLIGAWAT